MFSKLGFQSRSKKFWNRWLLKQYAIIVRSRLINIPYPDSFIISQLFLSIANALHGSLALTLSIKHFVVYPISLLSDLCNVNYAVQIAVLTTNTNTWNINIQSRSKYEIWCTKTRREYTTATSKLYCKVQETDRIFCCFHHLY